MHHSIAGFLRKNALVFLLVVLPALSAVLHHRAFPQDLMSTHVWRQTQTQSTILSFAEEDFHILHPRRADRGNGDGIFQMEFPLMQWLFAGVYKLFGNHLIITRLLSFLLGLFSVFGMYRWLTTFFNDRLTGLVGAWALAFSPAFFYYTVNPLPDNMALCCGIWGLAFTFRWQRSGRRCDLAIAAAMLGLATLIKLPFVLLYLPGVWLSAAQFRENKNLHLFVNQILTGTLSLLPAAAWYGTVIGGWGGNGVVKGILDNQTPWPQLARYCWDNLISTLPETLLNYAAVPLFALGIYYFFREKTWRDKRFPALLAGFAGLTAYYFFELNMITNVHDYYLFPFLPFLFLTVTYGVHKGFNLNKKIYNILIFILLVVEPAAAYLRMQARWDPARPGFNPALLHCRDALRAAVPDQAPCLAGLDISHAIYFYYIHKTGWALDNERPDTTTVRRFIREGAQYLYSDSRALEERLAPLLDSLLLDCEGVKVYRLKDRE